MQPAIMPRLAILSARGHTSARRRPRKSLVRFRLFVFFTKLLNQRNQMMHIIFAIFVVQKASP